MIVSSGSPLASSGNARLLSRFAFTLFTLLFLLGLPGRAGAQTTYNSSGGASISGATGTATNTITVSGAPGTVASVQVQINGIHSSGNTGASIVYTSFMLLGPNNQTFMLLGAAGDGYDNGGLNGLNILFKDGATAAPGTPPPPGASDPMPQTGSPTYEASSYWYNVNQGPVPANFAPPNVQLPQPDGIDDGYSNQTFASVFGGGLANGGWKLILESGEPAGYADPVSLSSWSLILTFSAAAPTTTSVTSSLNTTYTTSPSNSTTFTATVSSGSGTPTGTVAFTANGSTISGCSAQPMSGGQATCNATLTSQGIYNITATYSPSGSYGPSNGSTTQLVEVHPTQSSNTWCNPSSFVVPGTGTAGSVYPSVIHVSGYPAGTTVSNVEVQLKNLYGNAVMAQHLLVSPTNTFNLDFLDGAWENSVSSPGVNLNFLDSAGQYPDWPSQTNNPTSGSYEASDELESPNPDGFASASAPSIDTSIPQVPGTVNYAYNPVFPGERGPVTNTFEAMFNGAPANGDWALYGFTDLADPETISGGWCVELTLNTGTATATTVSSSQQQATANQSVNLTAQVAPTPSGGSVTFLDDGQTPSGTSGGNNVVTVNTSTGQATFPTGATSYSILTGATTYTKIYEGDHNFTAEYSGSSTDNPSNSATFWQRFDNATSAPAFNGGNSYSYCNVGPVVQNTDNLGAFLPNPSNVFVTNLPGTVNAVSVTLNGLFSNDGAASPSTQSLLKGPTGAALDFFSNTGSSTSNPSFGTGNYTFSDSASSQVPQSFFTPGNYKPTAYVGSPSTDSFTSSSSGFYNKPSSFNYAAPHGSSTFTTTFGNTIGNGTWSLFFDLSSFSGQEIGAANGWCVNLTENPVAITTTLGHSGTGASGDFVQNESGAAITVSVQNDSNTASAGDPAGSNANPLTVVDTLPTGLTYVAGSNGTGWTCAAAAQVVTCINDSASVAALTSYPTLTIDVNVAGNAAHSLSNPVTVSGATTQGSSGSDTITVDPPAALAVSLSHTGNFTQGQNDVWNVTVSNTASSGATSGTITVSDTLPTGYTLTGSSSTNNNFGCGAVSNVVTCTSTTAISAGSNNVINLTVGVAAASPTSVSTTALAWGGGDPVHTNSGNAATSTDTVTVIQVPASITLTAGNNQSAPIQTAFGTPLEVTVLDAGGVAINGQSVTFTAPSTGPSGFFSNSTTTISATTNSSGQVSEPVTAGSTAGAYPVTVQAGGASNSFSLTNLVGSPFTMSVVSGNGQSTFDTAPFSAPLVVLVTDAGSNPVPAATVTFTPPASGPSAVFAGGVNTATTNSSGIATSAALSANTQVGGPYTVSASSGVASTSFQLTNTVGPVTQLAVIAPVSAYTGVPIQFTVNALDAGGNFVIAGNDTLQFGSSDTAASLPPNATLVNGTGTFAATLNTIGSETINATDTVNNSIMGTSGGINVSAVPLLVVNTANDDSGTASASNCSVQTTPGNSTNSDNCSLRDALLESASLGAASISFDSTVFTGSTPINLASTLTIPSYTTITGPTNMVTVSGGNAVAVFQVNSGAITSLSNLVVANGTSSSGGSGLTNAGTTTITNSTFTGNQATGGAASGAIENTGTLTITGSTLANNSAVGGGNGGAIGNIGTLTLIESTVAGNSVDTGADGGGIENSGTLTIVNSTVSGNNAVGGGSGGGIASNATLNLANSIVAGNTAAASPDVFNSGSVSGGNNLIGDGTGSGFSNGTNGNQVGSPGNLVNPLLSPLGSNGGPTQTMLPLQGSTAICAGLQTNIPSGVFTDQRGFSNMNTTYPGYSAPAPCVDSGSVQTNYDIEFTQQPPAGVGPGQPITPSPALSVTESAMGVSGATVSMAATEGTLSGTTSVASSGGTATFDGLSIATAETGDTLTATLVLNPTLSIVRTSNPFNVAYTPPALTTPQPGTTLSNANPLTFTWDPGLGNTLFLLTIGSTTQGSTDVYYGATVPYTTTSVQVPNIPAYGQTLFARLHYYQNGVWSYIDYNYTEAGSPSPPALTTPQPGTTLSCADLSNCTVNFTWTPGGGSSFYRLRLGTTHPGSYDVYNGTEVLYPATSVQVSNIPATGGILYARFYYYQNGAWPYIDYTYTEAGSPTPPALTTPQPGTALSNTNPVTFTWTPGMGSTQFLLTVGTTGHGSTDVYYGTAVPSTTTSAQVSNIPANAQTLYARLYYYVNGAWSHIDYTYTEAGTPAPPALTTPQPGTTLSNTNPVTFTWTPGLGSTLFRLVLGTTGHGSTNVYNGAEVPNTTTSVQVSNIPAYGQTLYVRLHYYAHGTWSYIDYTYTEAGSPTLPALTTPQPETTLSCTGSPGCTVNFTWDPGLGSTLFRLRLGTTYPGSYDVYNGAPVPYTTTSVQVSNIPTTGATIYARFYYYLNGAWSYIDYTYTEQ
jgi:hypothetical protein